MNGFAMATPVHSLLILDLFLIFFAFLMFACKIYD